MDTSKANYFTRDASQTENFLKESSTLYSEICDKKNDTTDYDKKNDYDCVIKQFDELLSELSSVNTKKDKNSSLNKNPAFEDYNFTLNLQNSKTECAENYNKDFLINKKKVFYNQSSKVVPAPPKYEVESMDLDSRTNISKERHSYLSHITPSENNFNGKSFSDVKPNVQWINSHLWNLDKERQVSQFQKPNLQTNRKISTEDFKGNYYSSSQVVMPNMPQIANTFDASYLLKRQRNLPCYNTGINYNSKALSHARNPLQENHLYHQKLEFAKNRTGAISSIPRSPKASRSPTSKYISPNNCFLVKLYIETKDLHLGPFMFETFSKMTLRLLKLKVEQEHGIISSLQRWILGKHFAVDNDKSLADYNVLPGSSIIVYVDTEQKIPNNKAKNKVSGVINTTKFEDAQIFIKKQTSGSYDNLNIIGKESVELVRKDSLDSKLDESCLKTNAKLHNSFENEIFDVPLKERKIKMLASETQNAKEGLGSKKQTKIIIHDKQDLSIHNDNKNSFLNTQNIDNLTKYTPDLMKKVHGTEKQSSNSMHMKPLFKEIPEKYQLMFLNQSQNVSSGNNETNLIQINEHINNKPEELNFGEIKDTVERIECDYEKIDIKCNSKEKHVENACGNIKDAYIDSENKNQDINFAYASNEFLTQPSENTLLDVSSLKKVNIVDSVCMNPDEKSKCKQSITSLIRKLSLTRKTKSTEDGYSQVEACNKAQDIEINNQNDSTLFTQNISQSIPSDIHIEILPCDCHTISPEEECIVQQIGENLPTDTTDHDAESTKNFELFLEIENLDLVQNTFHFSCPVCFEEFESGQGVILHDCLHAFCRDCLINAVCYADGALVKCPYRDDFYTCQSHLQQREIKALVSEDMYEKYLQRSITTAEGLAERSFHCKTPDCKGWCIYDNAINVFHCPVCSHYNCLNCQAIHEGLNCRRYQDKLKLQQKVDKESEKTLSLLNEMIKSGKALRCPKCDLILLKKWGCDWLKCSICKTEICWITKGPRWGPGGQGDTSGGCKCGVNGVKCHPSCTYCH